MLVEEKNWPKRQLQIECKSLSEGLLWSDRLHRGVTYIYPMKCSGWVALLMTRYHQQAVEIIKTLPTLDRFFYQTKSNRFKQLSIWCVREKSSQDEISQLKQLPDLQLEPLNLEEQREIGKQGKQGDREAGEAGGERIMLIRTILRGDGKC